LAAPLSVAEVRHFEVGAKVEGNYRGLGVWYPGRIEAFQGDGRYDLNYDDGEKEMRVDATRIRLAAPLSVAEVRHFEVGAKVEGNYRGLGVWYPGRIEASQGDGRYDLSYDDGEKEMRVDATRIRLAAEDLLNGLDHVVDAPLNIGGLKPSRDVEISSIQLDGEVLCDSRYDSASIRIHILDEVWNDSPTRKTDAGSTSRTYTPSWPQFLITSEAFQSDSMMLSVLAQGKGSSSSNEDKDTRTGPTHSRIIPLSKFCSSEFSIKETIETEDGSDPLSVVIHGCSRESKDIPSLLMVDGMSPDYDDYDNAMTAMFDDNDKVLNNDYGDEYEGLDDFEDDDPMKIDRMMSTSCLDLLDDATLQQHRHEES